MWSVAALYEAAGLRPAVAWLSAFPVNNKRSPEFETMSATYHLPLGSRTYQIQIHKTTNEMIHRTKDEDEN